MDGWMDGQELIIIILQTLTLEALSEQGDTLGSTATSSSVSRLSVLIRWSLPCLSVTTRHWDSSEKSI